MKTFIIYNPAADDIGCHMTTDDTGRVPALYETEILAWLAIQEHDRERLAAGMEPEFLSIREFNIEILNRKEQEK